MVMFIQLIQKDIKFDYRQTDLPKNLIFLSASFKTTKKDKTQIEENINKLKEKNRTLNL